MASKESKLFIIGYYNTQGNGDVYQAKLSNLIRQLSSLTTNYKVMFIWHKTSDKRSAIWRESDIENLFCLDISTLEESTGINFKNKEDDEFFDQTVRTKININ